MTARWGRTPHHTGQHIAAPKVQSAYPGLIVWFGEATGHFYLMDDDGLHECPTQDALLMAAWWRARRPVPRGSAPAPARRGRAGRHARPAAVHAAGA